MISSKAVRLSAIAGAVVFVGASSASGAGFPLIVEITSGSLTGNTYNGFISVSDSFIPALGTVTLRPNNSDLTVSFDFQDGAGLPKTYTESDDDSFAGFPAFRVTDGAPVFLDMRVPALVAGQQFQFNTNGTFVYSDPTAPASGVYRILPTPGAAALLAFAGLTAARRRR